MTDRKPRAVYTDPRWAVDDSGGFDPALADIEHDVYGDSVEVQFGLENVSGANALMVLRTKVGAELLDA
ncbi:MAG: C-terminal binding protein, partial [Candidatus Eremiobacteraeota bacterium]|nr:C-terminal binding protein [Candidatus Eremiobacteraeota bacterium]